MAQGDLDNAESSYLEALSIFGNTGMDELAGWARCGLGHIAVRRGDLLAARQQFAEMARRRAIVYGTAGSAAHVVPHVAPLFAAEGRHEVAARFLGSAAAARARSSSPGLYGKDRQAEERARKAARIGLGDEAFGRAWDQGSATPMEMLMPEVEELLRAPPRPGR